MVPSLGGPEGQASQCTAADETPALVATLRACAAEFKRDRFWADMAKPVDRALGALERSDQALAVRELQAALRSLPPAELNSVGLFAQQRRDIVGVLGALGAGERAPSPPPRPPPPPLAPYAFEQTEAEVTVTLAVPAGTRKGDVAVKFGRTAVRVAVAGHPTQPALLDGRLEHPVDVDGCGWCLSGEGDQRALCLNFEKASAGLRWTQLLLGGGEGAPADDNDARGIGGGGAGLGAVEAARLEGLNELMRSALLGTSELRPHQPAA